MVRPTHPIARKLHWAAWLVRYWVMDKHYDECRTLAHWGAALITSVLVVKLGLDAFAGSPGHAAMQAGCAIRRAAWAGDDCLPLPRTAVYWWVVQLVVLVISALVSYALRPKPTSPEPVAGKEPETKDGKSLRRTYGTCWTDDSAMVGWVNGTAEPIRKKGGKK